MKDYLPTKFEGGGVMRYQLHKMRETNQHVQNNMPLLRSGT